MKVNFCARRYRDLYGNWERAYNLTINAFQRLGFQCNLSPFIKMSPYPKNVGSEIVNSYEDIYVYNHTYEEEIIRNKFWLGRKAFFLKPTGPTPDYFTIDTEGYACGSSITYQKPAFENVDSTKFFDTKVKEFKEIHASKWADHEHLQVLKKPVNTPKEHILLIGQMPGDETVTKFSFGNHWTKFIALVNFLSEDYDLVVKIHPTLESETKKVNQWEYHYSTIRSWIDRGITVFYGFESIHNILPNTKVAIVENSTAGLECMMYDVPMISYGYPEYHWITKDLRHLHKVKEYIDNLFWFDKGLSRKWLTWYCSEYQCYNEESTLQRLKTIL
jgi:hypothetical protein